MLKKLLKSNLAHQKHHSKILLKKLSVSQVVLIFLALPKKEAGFAFTPITKEMLAVNAFKTIRTELKTTKGFYKRLEAIKKRGKPGVKK
jgi:hypothetical protein